MALVGCQSSQAAFPSPEYANLTVDGNASIAGNLGVAGAASIIGGGSLQGTFTGPSVIRGLTAGLQNYTTANKPGSGTPGDVIYITDCQNGSQAFPGTGCPAWWSGNAWVLMPSPPSAKISIGSNGLSAALGGTIPGQGDGTSVLTVTGAVVAGDCLQVSPGGAAQDAGSPCGTGGGGGGPDGTIIAGAQNAVGYYSGGGTAKVISPTNVQTNGVVVTDGTGKPNVSTSLPVGVTAPGLNVSNGNLTGTTTLAGATFTGKATFAASTTGAASQNVPQGVTPTAPANGDRWSTAVGTFAQINSVTQGPFLYNVATTAPLAGGGVGPLLTLTCPNCLAVTGGGTLTAGSGITITPGSGIQTIAAGSVVRPLTWATGASFTVINDQWPLIERWPLTGNGVIQGVVFHTGGTSTPSFQASVNICTGGTGGTCTPVAGCSGLSVANFADTVATCTGLNTVATNQTVALFLSGVSGSPTSAAFQLNMSIPPI